MAKFNSRRKFLRQLGGTAAIIGTGSVSSLAAEEQAERRIIYSEKKFSTNDTIRIAGIGMGIMGFNDVNTALKVKGTELVAVCDLYDGRLTRSKEVYGKNIFTTRNYQEILDRKDIDAVIIATSDHWHDRISIDAMRKGKHVYCEKPMVHHIEEGHAVINTQKETKKTFEVGSQGVSSATYAEAKRLLHAGEIGDLNLIEASFNRHSALGAWQYSIPPDASTQTVDWNRYLGDAPKRGYDANRFFRWRNYRDYGTGVAGDLFIHLISGIHFITGSLGPKRVFATGELSYWKDGRDVPDVMTGIIEYPKTDTLPAFQLAIKVNFASGEGEKSVLKFVGSDGVMDLGGEGLKITKDKLPKAPGYGGWDSFDTFPEAIQKEFVKQYDSKYSAADKSVPDNKAITFNPPKDDDEHRDHFMNFFEGVRTGKPVVEDASFGLRAAGPALACNESYFKGKVINWDPVAMKVV